MHDFFVFQPSSIGLNGQIDEVNYRSILGAKIHRIYIEGVAEEAALAEHFSAFSFLLINTPGQPIHPTGGRQPWAVIHNAVGLSDTNDFR